MAIKQCKCKHAAQDELHGKGNRVHTTDKEGQDRCTVCGPQALKQERLVLHAKNWLPIHSMK